MTDSEFLDKAAALYGSRGEKGGQDLLDSLAVLFAQCPDLTDANKECCRKTAMLAFFNARGNTGRNSRQ